MGYQLSSPIRKFKGFNVNPIAGELSKSSNNIRNPFNLSRLPLTQHPCYSSLTHAVLSINAVSASPDQPEAIKSSKKTNGLLPFSVYHKSSSSGVGPQVDFTDTHRDLRELLVREIPQLFKQALASGLTAPFDSLLLVSDATSSQFRRFQGSRAFMPEGQHSKGIFTPANIPRLLPGFYPVRLRSCTEFER